MNVRHQQEEDFQKLMSEPVPVPERVILYGHEYVLATSVTEAAPDLLAACVYAREMLAARGVRMPALEAAIEKAKGE